MFHQPLDSRAPSRAILASLLALALARLGAGQAAADGTAASWGSNSAGQLGINSSSTSDVLVPAAIYSADSLNGKTLVQISAGALSACGVTSDGGVYCWGTGASGRLGNNATADSLVSVAVDTSGVLSGKAVVQVSAGGSHACAVTSDGGVYCWGAGLNGRLGNNATADSLVPVAVDTSGVLNGKTVVQVSAGADFTCAVTSDGGAYCWGAGLNGRLGNNATADSLVPVAVSTAGALNGKTVVQVSAGGSHACAVTSDGGAYCWGNGTSGRLGNGSSTSQFVPVAVSTAGALNGKTVVQVDAGSTSSCAITSEGLAYCWGTGSSGALGNNLGTGSLVPVAVYTSGALNGKFVSQIEVGYLRACVVTSDGGVYCWGSAANGALGNNATSPNALVPVAVDASGVLSGKFVSQAATVNSTIPGAGFSNAVAPAGGPGRAIAAGPTATWQLMGTVCTPSGSATVADILGDGSPMNLTTADYNVPDPTASKGWVLWRHDASTNRYVRLAATDTLSLGTGYWFRSYQPGRQSRLIMNCPDTAPQAPVTQADGCASASGCVAIPLTSVAGVDQQNLLGNPFPYAIDWSQVRVRIDGSGSYTPSQAAGLAGSGNAPFAAISNTFYVWNGTSYASYSDSGVTAGQLPYFSSFWVKVLSGSFGHTVELLIPNLPTPTASPF